MKTLIERNRNFFSFFEKSEGVIHTSALRPLFFILMTLSLSFSVSCVKNGKPKIEDLIKVSQPSFDGQKVISGKIAASFSTASTAYVLDGKCDPDSYLLEYSIDNGTTWTEIAGGCVNSQFSITLSLVTGYLEVLVRAKGKFNYTAITTAKIRLLRPPTANSFYLAGSSKSDNSEQIGLGSQNIMPSAISGEIIEGTNTIFKNNLPAIAYE